MSQSAASPHGNLHNGWYGSLVGFIIFVGLRRKPKFFCGFRARPAVSVAPFEKILTFDASPHGFAHDNIASGHNQGAGIPMQSLLRPVQHADRKRSAIRINIFVVLDIVI